MSSDLERGRRRTHPQQDVPLCIEDGRLERAMRLEQLPRDSTPHSQLLLHQVPEQSPLRREKSVPGSHHQFPHPCLHTRYSLVSLLVPKQNIKHLHLPHDDDRRDAKQRSGALTRIPDRVIQHSLLIVRNHDRYSRYGRKLSRSFCSFEVRRSSVVRRPGVARLLRCGGRLLLNFCCLGGWYELGGGRSVRGRTLGDSSTACASAFVAAWEGGGGGGGAEEAEEGGGGWEWEGVGSS